MHDGCLHHIETNPMICSSNHWTDFYITGTSIIKELMAAHINSFLWNTKAVFLTLSIYNYCSLSLTFLPGALEAFFGRLIISHSLNSFPPKNSNKILNLSDKINDSKHYLSSLSFNSRVSRKITDSLNNLFSMMKLIGTWHNDMEIFLVTATVKL